MSTMTLIWLASLAGALLFSAAGFFAARGRAAAPARDVEGDLAREREIEHQRAQEWQDRTREREALQALAAQAEERARAARAAAAAAVDDLARHTEETARNRATLDDQTMTVARLQQEVEILRQAKASPPPAPAPAPAPRTPAPAPAPQRDMAKYDRELATARAKVAETTSRAAQEKAQAASRIAELEATVSRLSAEIEAASTKERRTSSLLNDARSETRQLGAEVDVARGRIEALTTETDSLRREVALVVERSVGDKKTLEDVRTENAVLRGGSAELLELKKRVEVMREENERLRAAAFVVHAEQRARRSYPTTPEYTDTSPAGSMDNASLQRFVDDVLKTPSVSAAALTDELGFLVVGGGDHTEALAAFGAYLTDAGARACGLLPMHAVHKVSIQDDSGITLTARTIASAPNELVLVTLGVDDKKHGQQDGHEMEISRS